MALLLTEGYPYNFVFWVRPSGIICMSNYCKGEPIFKIWLKYLQTMIQFSRVTLSGSVLIFKEIRDMLISFQKIYNSQRFLWWNQKSFNWVRILSTN